MIIKVTIELQYLWRFRRQTYYKYALRQLELVHEIPRSDCWNSTEKQYIAVWKFSPEATHIRNRIPTWSELLNQVTKMRTICFLLSVLFSSRRPRVISMKMWMAFVRALNVLSASMPRFSTWKSRLVWMLLGSWLTSSNTSFFTGLSGW